MRVLCPVWTSNAVWVNRRTVRSLLLHPLYSPKRPPVTLLRTGWEPKTFYWSSLTIHLTNVSIDNFKLRYRCIQEPYLREVIPWRSICNFYLLKLFQKFLVLLVYTYTCEVFSRSIYPKSKENWECRSWETVSFVWLCDQNRVQGCQNLLRELCLFPVKTVTPSFESDH